MGTSASTKGWIIKHGLCHTCANKGQLICSGCTWNVAYANGMRYYVKAIGAPPRKEIWQPEPSREDILEMRIEQLEAMVLELMS